MSSVILNANNLNSTSSTRNRSTSVVANTARNIPEPSAFYVHNEPTPNIGNVTLQNTSDTTIGNRTTFHAPVTINQTIYRKFSWNLSRRKKIVISITSGIVIAALLLFLFFIFYEIEDDFSPPPNFKLIIVSREGWSAKPPTNITNLELPSNRIIIFHTVTHNCVEKSDCASQIQGMQNFHMNERGRTDIGYNFLVGGDGLVYAGRGWDVQGENIAGFDAKSIGIAFIGNFSVQKPSKQQLYAALKLIDEGVKLEKLTPDYRLYGHRQFVSSESPGEALYRIIVKWEHWSNKIEK